VLLHWNKDLLTLFVDCEVREGGVVFSEWVV